MIYKNVICDTPFFQVAVRRERLEVMAISVLHCCG